MSIRVLLVDDHPVVREGLRAMLAAEADLEVVGEAGDAEAALEAVEALRPDVVLMDVRLPGMSGLQACGRMVARRPDLPVVLLTVHESELYLLEGLRSGAAGYLMKDSPACLIVQSVRAAFCGGSVVERPLLARALAEQRDLARLQPGGHPSEVRLSPRELEVLRLVAEGHGNRAIATTMSLAEVTVKKHVQSLIRKLGARDRTHAAILASRLGLVE